MQAYIRTTVWILAGLVAAAGARATEWQLVPDQSRLSFTAIQQKAEFEGIFKDFSADIVFDPAQPEAGSINAVILLASVDTQYGERDGYLVDPDWFFVERWPEATYVADSVRVDEAGEADTWIAAGELTIRDVTLPVELRFRFTEDSDGAAFVGTAGLSRLDFNVGNVMGWDDTRWVGDPVKVKVELRLQESK
ncbi:MAG: YceI family protein [Gammaproteobacteria bacterium]|nr:YceI family protein [Gammaproteobacteria bacterium]